MLSMEARRNPVNQAAAAFFLIAGGLLAGLVLKVAGSPFASGHAPIGAAQLIVPSALVLIGGLVLRGSRAALVVGTTFWALVVGAGTVGGVLLHATAARLVFMIAWDGALLFVMARAIPVLWRKR